MSTPDYDMKVARLLYNSYPLFKFRVDECSARWGDDALPRCFASSRANIAEGKYTFGFYYGVPSSPVPQELIRLNFETGDYPPSRENMEKIKLLLI